MSESNNRIPRHVYFQPAVSAEVVQSALDSDADVVLLELEDGVHPTMKAEARRLAAKVCSAADRAITVRINDCETLEFEDDIQELVESRVPSVVLPKVFGAEEINKADASLEKAERAHGVAIGSTRLIPMIETVSAAEHIDVILAASARVEGAFFGLSDFMLDCEAPAIQGGGFVPSLLADYARLRVALATRSAGLMSIASTLAPREDFQARVAAMRHALSLGFTTLVVVGTNGVAQAETALRLDDEAETFAAEVVASADSHPDEAITRCRGWFVEKGIVDLTRYLQARGKPPHAQ